MDTFNAGCTKQATQWKTQRSWVLLFIGSCFFLPALLLLFISTFPGLIDWQRMSHWPSVPATLTSASLDIKRTENGNQFQAIARYRYHVGSQTYTNDRVAIVDSADSMGNFQKNLSRKLRRALNGGSMVPAYYNPSEPQDSVLNRDFRPEIILMESVIAVVVALLGGALILLGWRGEKINAAADLEREPWKGNAAWQGGPIFFSRKNWFCRYAYFYGILEFHSLVNGVDCWTVAYRRERPVRSSPGGICSNRTLLDLQVYTVRDAMAAVW